MKIKISRLLFKTRYFMKNSGEDVFMINDEELAEDED